MIVAIGGTGSGKGNSLIDWLSRKGDSFYKTILVYKFHRGRIFDKYIEKQNTRTRNIHRYER